MFVRVLNSLGQGSGNIEVLGYGFFGGSVAQSIADNIGRDLELQVLPGGLNVLLGAVTILGLSTKQLVTLPLLLDATTDLFGERLQWKGQLLMKARGRRSKKQFLVPVFLAERGLNGWAH